MLTQTTTSTAYERSSGRWTRSSVWTALRWRAAHSDGCPWYSRSPKAYPTTAATPSWALIKPAPISNAITQMEWVYVTPGWCAPQPPHHQHHRRGDRGDDRPADEKQTVAKSAPEGGKVARGAEGQSGPPPPDDPLDPPLGSGRGLPAAALHADRFPRAHPVTSGAGRGRSARPARIVP